MKKQNLFNATITLTIICLSVWLVGCSSLGLTSNTTTSSTASSSTTTTSTTSTSAASTTSTSTSSTTTTTGSLSATWIKTYDGGSYEAGNQISIDNSNNIHVAGVSAFVPDCKLLARKYNSDGALQWSASQESGGGAAFGVLGSAIDSSGNFHVLVLDAGIAEGYLLHKFNSSGTYVGYSTYEGYYYLNVAVDDNDNLYFCGITSEAGSTDHDCVISKYNSSGDLVWTQRKNSNSTTTTEGASQITLDDSGNAYVAGYTGELGAYDLVTIKYNNSGVEQWTATYESGGHDNPAGIATDGSGNVYVATSNNADGDVIYLKYDEDGTLLWDYTHDGGDTTDLCEGLAVDSSGNLYILNNLNNQSEYEIVKFNSSGTKLFSVTYDTNEHDEGYDISQDSQGAIYVCGETGGSSIYTRNLFLTKFE